MSTDTKYFNSSRLMTASSKNKTNGVTRLDKKRTQAERKNKVRQETVDIPQPQMLPNGGKPDFGHSSSRRKQKGGSGRQSSSSGSDGRKHSGKNSDAQQVTEDLKQLFLKPEESGPKVSSRGSSEKSLKGKQSRPATSPSISDSHVSPHLGNPSGFQSPESHTGVISGSNQNFNPVGSPIFVRPGLYPPASPSSAPHAVARGLPGHPNGNYSLTSPTAVPHFMAPQAPLINPMYPQIPLAQLPVMYKALDIQQQQLQQQYQQQQHQPPNQLPSGYHPSNYQQYHPQQQPQQFSVPSLAVPYSLPMAASYQNGPQVTAVKPLEQEKPRRAKNKTKGTNTCFAGASFASSDPKVNKLPKPSFTKA